MGLFRRISDILSANLHDLVDRFEDPEQMLRQAVREMETTLAHALDGAAKVIASEKILAKLVRDRTAESVVWQQRALRAVSEEDDSRARQALVHRHQFDRTTQALQTQLAATQEQSTALRRQIDALRIKMSEARQLQTTLVARHRAAQARRKILAATNCMTVDDAAFGRFERARAQVEQAEAESDAVVELAAWKPDDNAFLGEDDSWNVEIELATLRQQAAQRS